MTDFLVKAGNNYHIEFNVTQDTDLHFRPMWFCWWLFSHAPKKWTDWICSTVCRKPEWPGWVTSFFEVNERININHRPVYLSAVHDAFRRDRLSVLSTQKMHVSVKHVRSACHYPVCISCQAGFTHCWVLVWILTDLLQGQQSGKWEKLDKITHTTGRLLADIPCF